MTPPNNANVDTRSVILATAQQLFFERSYEKTSVQNIIDEIGIAKGTFYHHFKSKSALLNAQIEQAMAAQMAILQPIVDAEDLDAISKINRMFAATTQWKTVNKHVLQTLAKTLYREENLAWRERAKERSYATIVPKLATIVRQGIAEGSFDTPFPDQAARMLLSINTNLSDAIASKMRNPDLEIVVEHIIEIVQANHNAIERILGAPADSIQMLDPAFVLQWFETDETKKTATGGN